MKHRQVAPPGGEPLKIIRAAVGNTVRMVPVEELFLRFPRVVRDLAERSGKQIGVTIEGEETRLDRTIIERLADPMVHLIRNAVDHGLETPAERLATGKSAGDVGFRCCSSGT